MNNIENGIKDVGDTIGELKENLTDLQEIAETRAAAIYETVSGSIASFSDGADDMPMKSAVVSIEPIQDLHGYDSPWPDGGGKNLFDWNKVSVGGTYYGMTFSKGVAEGTVTITGTLSVTHGSVAPIAYADNSLSGKGYVFLTEHISGDSVVDLAGTYGLRTETEKSIAVYLSGTRGQSYTETIRISVYAPPAPVTWSPYSNICPISGRTGLSVVRTGKNVLKLSDWENENNSGITIGTDNISILNKGYQEALNRYNVLNRSACVFSFHVKTITLTASTASFAVYANGPTKLVGSGTETTGNILLNSVGTEKDIKLTVPNGTEYISFGGWAWGGEVQISNLQLELGSAATEYEPYKGSTYSVNWETEAGTVYGGTLDVVSGKLTVDRAMVDLGNLSQWNADANRPGVFYTGSEAQRRKMRGVCVCSQYKWLNDSVPSQDNLSTADNTISLYPSYGGGYIYIVDIEKATMTPQEFKAAMSGVQLVYELANSTEIQLTPQEVRTLLGANNIWSDGGDVEVEYPADTKMYINKKITEAIAAAMA